MSGEAGPVSIDISNYSEVQLQRLKYVPPVPAAVRDPASARVVPGEATAARSAVDERCIAAYFPNLKGKETVTVGSGASGTPVAASAAPLRVGVVFCGRQCPGGNNVVAGLFDFLTPLGGQLLGFTSGTKGLFEGKYVEITADKLAPFRNQGGYHLLGRSVDKIRSGREQAAVLATCNSLKLDGLVLVGGTFTNTDAAHLAEYLVSQGCSTRVIGVPVTIDGDVRNSFVEATLGFDTATKVFSQLVGNMATDSNSAKKYYYFVRLMGRAASHISLEVALQTHPNVVLLGEDIESRKLGLTDIVRELADVVAARAAKGKNFGVVLVPEGAVSYIPEMRTLLAEMNQLFADGVESSAIPSKLTPWSQAVLNYLPPFIRQQLFLERESSGAVQLSQISTEKLLAELVGDELARRKTEGKYSGKYASLSFFFGYQSRCSLPSNFDCSYGDTLGRTAAALVAAGCNGYMATVRKLAGPVESWEPAGVPLTAMMTVPVPGSTKAQAYSEASSPVSGGGAKPVIESASVDVLGGPFASYSAQAREWALEEKYCNPGPIQFGGPTANDVTLTLQSDTHDYMARIGELRGLLGKVRDLCKPGVSDGLLDSALSGMVSLVHILEVMKKRE